MKTVDNIYVTEQELHDDYALWKSLSPPKRLDFLTRRQSLISENQNNQSITEKWAEYSSGTSGPKKLMEFGPNACEINNFFINMAFRDLQYDQVIFIRLVMEGQNNLNIDKIDIALSDITINKFYNVTWLPVFKVLTLNIHKLQTNKLYNLITNNGKNKVIIYSGPTIFNILLRFGMNLELMDPAKITFVSTGEILIEEDARTIRSHGYILRDCMRVWDGGATFYTCKYGNKHWIDMISNLYIDQNDALISTDMYNIIHPYINYHNGDHLNIYPEETCQCGYRKMRINFHQREYEKIQLDEKEFDYQHLSHISHQALMRQNINDNDILPFTFGHYDNLLVIYYYYKSSDKINEQEYINAWKEIAKVCNSRICIVNLKIVSYYKEQKIFLLSERRAQAYISANESL